MAPGSLSTSAAVIVSTQGLMEGYDRITYHTGLPVSDAEVAMVPPSMPVDMSRFVQFRSYSMKPDVSFQQAKGVGLKEENDIDPLSWPYSEELLRHDDDLQEIQF